MVFLQSSTAQIPDFYREYIKIEVRNNRVGINGIYQYRNASDKTLYIGYTQELLGNKAEYILTTTKKWKKPLESSEFELIVPDDYFIDSMSYIPDDSIVSGNRKHYFVRKVNFMPEENFVVIFQTPE